MRISSWDMAWSRSFCFCLCPLCFLGGCFFRNHKLSVSYLTWFAIWYTMGVKENRIYGKTSQLARCWYQARSQEEIKDWETQETVNLVFCAVASIQNRLQDDCLFASGFECKLLLSLGVILSYITNGTPHRSRTCSLWYRKPTLYPVELTGQVSS